MAGLVPTPAGFTSIRLFIDIIMQDMDILVKLLPTFALIGLGYFLKRQRIFDADLGRTLSTVI